MGRYTTGAKIWVSLVASAAALAILHGIQNSVPSPDDLLLLAVLAFCAALAHMFPIRSALGGATYRPTSVFIVAGAVLLPPALAAALPVLALTPDSIVKRKSPGVWVRWTFNVSQSAVAAYIVGTWVRFVTAYELGELVHLVALLGAAAGFVLLQETLLGVVIALQSRISIRRADVFAWPSLFSNGLLGLLGIGVAGLWLARPVLVLLVPPVLFIAHRMTRTAYLVQQSQLDLDSGLHNSRHFEQALEEALTHSRRLSRPLSLLFLDLDHFKRVNDHHGHAVGDQVLRQVARLLAESFRNGDLVARLGGEEFVVLLPNTDAREGMYLAERARAAIEAASFPAEDGTTVMVTASIGVVVSPDDGTHVATVMKQGEMAVFRAKQTRNAVARARALSSEPAADRVASAVPRVSPARLRLGNAVLWTSVALGSVVALWSAVMVHIDGGWLTLLPLLVLALVAEFLEVRVYEANRQKISFSYTVAVTMAAMAAYPMGMPLVSLTAAAAHIIRNRQRQLAKASFNLANPALAAGIASGVYLLLRGDYPALSLPHLGAALVGVLAFYSVNVGIIWLMISLFSGRSFLSVLRESIWYGPTEVLLGMTGAFLGSAYLELGPLGTGIFAAPLMLMRFTLAFYARRSQQTIESMQATSLQLQQLNEQLATEIAQRTVMEQENSRLAREAARADALEEVSRLKSEFISIASHELRTPLTTILGFSEMLLGQTPTDDPRRRFLSVIHSDSVQLAGLIENLLDISRIENGRMSIDPSWVDLSATIPALLEGLGSAAPKHTLVADLDPPAQTVWADAGKLQQVLTNLVSNAIKYSPRGGEVRVTVRKTPEGGVRIAVSDQGLGIPPEHLGRIFERFQRVDVKETRGIRGTGLGLYIVKHLVELHGGHVWVESEPGKGSSFTLALPAPTEVSKEAGTPPTALAEPAAERTEASTGVRA